MYFGPARIRALLYSLIFKSTGKEVFIFGPFRCGSPENISVGENVVFSNNCVLGGEFGIDIGNFVMIAQNASIVSANHSYDIKEIPMMRQPMKGKKIIIKDDVWIGANSIVLPGITINQGAVVGSNSVVTKDVEPYSIVVGSPAKPIKKRFSEDAMKLLLDKDKSPLFKYYKNDSKKSFVPKVYLKNE